MAIIRKRRSAPMETAEEAVSLDQRELDLSASESVTREDLQPEGVRLEAEASEVDEEASDEESSIEESDDEASRDRSLAPRVVIRPRAKKRPLRVELIKENGIPEEASASGAFSPAGGGSTAGPVESGSAPQAERRHREWGTPRNPSGAA